MCVNVCMCVCMYVSVCVCVCMCVCVFVCVYAHMPGWWTSGKLIGFKILTMAHSKGQGQGHGNSDFANLVTDWTNIIIAKT